MEENRRVLAQRILDYRGERFVNDRLGAQLGNDESVSLNLKAKIWFDLNVMRFKWIREAETIPWYPTLDPKSGELEDPIIDFVFDEAIWLVFHIQLPNIS